MKPSKNLLYLTLLCILFGMLISCKAQYGCPSNGKNVGAERIFRAVLSADPSNRAAQKLLRDLTGVRR